MSDATFTQGRFEPRALRVDANGLCASAGQAVSFPGRLVLPGLVNAHSHAFQRVLRGRTELRAEGREADDFWSWRERMYEAATTLTPEQLYVVSRQAFIEMALAGITTVGEFHYVQHQPDGTPYDDESLLAKTVIQAARDVGLRIVLLRVAYARAGSQVEPNPRQRRFIDANVELTLKRVEALRAATKGDALVSVGIAPHSVRAVPKAWLETIAKSVTNGPVHAHVAEQPAEVKACLAEHGRRPVELLADVGLLSNRFTAVHAIHLDENEVKLFAESGSTVCACPSTERNLGDGVVPADALINAGVPVSLGSDSQAHIDLLDEARQLEGHLRLVRLRRAVLFPSNPTSPRDGALGATLLQCATAAGARALGTTAATLAEGTPADFITLDRDHPSLIGVPDEALPSAVALAASSAAIRDVAVQGKLIVRDGQHPLADESARAFKALMRTLA